MNKDWGWSWKERRGQDIRGVKCLYNGITMNEFRERGGEKESEAEKHQEMQVSGLGISNDCNKEHLYLQAQQW